MRTEVVVKHSQTEKLLNYFREVEKEITPLVAKQVLGIERLASRIHELREHGWSINRRMKKDAAGHRYASYKIMNTYGL